MLKYVAKGEDREHKQGKYLNQRWQGGPKTISVIIFIRVPLEVWALRNMVTENNTPSTKSVNLLTIVLLQEFPFYINNIYKNNGVQIFQIWNKLFKY